MQQETKRQIAETQAANALAASVAQQKAEIAARRQAQEEQERLQMQMKIVQTQTRAEIDRLQALAIAGLWMLLID